MSKGQIQPKLLGFSRIYTYMQTVVLQFRILVKSSIYLIIFLLVQLDFAHKDILYGCYIINAYM